ncbi:MAG: CD225/dispanin family protein [Clostridium sp.]|nr:CD225/dispanin family protein [Clostridium sp.]
MKVWIHVNGIQEGPFMLEELPLDRMDADTPVWYNGLPDWMPAGQAPEVAQILAQRAASCPNPVDEPQTQEEACDCAVDAPAQENTMPNQGQEKNWRQQAAPGQQQPQSQPGWQQPRIPQQPMQGWGPQPGYQQPGGPQPGYQQPGWQQPGYQQPGWQQPRPQNWSEPWRAPIGPDGMPMPCPPTYLVWSILLTVLCCNPVGIVAIIYGFSVRSKFYSGDVEGAQRASNATQWWLAISIVTGLIMSCCGFLII